LAAGRRTRHSPACEAMHPLLLLAKLHTLVARFLWFPKLAERFGNPALLRNSVSRYVWHCDSRAELLPPLCVHAQRETEFRAAGLGSPKRFAKSLSDLPTARVGRRGEAAPPFEIRAARENGAADAAEARIANSGAPIAIFGVPMRIRPFAHALTPPPRWSAACRVVCNCKPAPPVAIRR
jgi:hypothetical protein